MAETDVSAFENGAGRPATRPRLTLPQSLVFSSISIPLSVLGLAISVYLPPYFASHLGVSLTVVGAAFFTVRMIDIPVDVILAAFMDRTKTPFGRYRVWLLIGAPMLTFAVWRLFMAPHGFSFTYLVSWLLIYYLSTSIIGLAHSAWAAKIAPRYDDRSRLFAVLSAVGVLGALAGIAIPIVGPNLGLPPGQAVPWMGWGVIALSLPTALLVALFTAEPIEPDVPGERIEGEGIGAQVSRGLRTLWEFAKDLWLLFTKPDLVRMFLAQMALTLGPGWMSALYLFYFQGPRGFTGAESSILLALYILAGLIGAPLTGRAAMRFGKHRTLMITTTAYSLGLMTVVILPVGNMAAAVPVMLWCGAMASGFDLMVRAMLADVGDEVRLESGRERISLIYSVNTLAGKIASAFSIGLTYPLLQRLGFDATDGAHNTAQALHNLELSYIIGPIVFVMLGGACVIGWRLNAEKHNAIRRELEARDALVVTKAPVLETLEGP